MGNTSNVAGYKVIGFSPHTSTKASQKYAREHGGVAGWELGVQAQPYQWAVYARVEEPQPQITHEELSEASKSFTHAESSLERKPTTQTITTIGNTEFVGSPFFSEAMAKKIEEAQPYAEHEALKSEQINKGIVTPTYKEPQVLVVTPVEKPKPTTVESTTVTETTTGKYNVTPIKYGEFTGIQNETIGYTTIGEKISVSKNLPSPIKELVTEHEILHNVYPEKSELDILKEQILGRGIDYKITPDNKVLIAKTQSLKPSIQNLKPNLNVLSNPNLTSLTASTLTKKDATPIRNTYVSKPVVMELPEETTARKAMHELKLKETEKQFESMSLYKKAVGYVVTASSPEEWKKVGGISSEVKKDMGKSLVVETLTRKKEMWIGKPIEDFMQQWKDVMTSPAGFQLSTGIQTQVSKVVSERLFEPTIKQSIQIDVSKTSDYGKTFESTVKGKIIIEVDRPIAKFLRENLLEDFPLETKKSDILLREIGMKTGKDTIMVRGIYSVDTEGKFATGRFDYPEMKIENIKGFQDIRGFGVRTYGNVGEGKDLFAEFTESKEVMKVSKDVAVQMGATDNVLQPSKYPSSVYANWGASAGSDYGYSYNAGLSRSFKIPQPDTSMVDMISPTKTLTKLKPFPAIQQIESLQGNIANQIIKSSTIKLSALPITKVTINENKWNSQRLAPREWVEQGVVYASPEAMKLKEPTIKLVSRLSNISIQTSELGKVSSRLTQQMKQSTSQKQSASLAQSLQQTQLTESITKPVTSQITKPITSTKLSSDLKKQLAYYNVNPNLGHINVNIPFEPIPPISPLGFHFKRESMFEKKKSSRDYFGKQQTKYQPSLAGIFSRVTIRKAPKRMLSGMEIRYPVVGKKRKKL